MKPAIINQLLIISLLFLLSSCSNYTKGEPIESKLPPKYAFLVIDIQNDFMSNTGKLPIGENQSTNIIKTINKLSPIFNQNKIETIYIENKFKKYDLIANWFRNNAALEGTDGEKLSPDLTIVNDKQFYKSSPDAFSNKIFDKYLRTKKITKLIVAGVFADQCVLSTIQGALNRKYGVYVISDAIGAKNDNDINKALKKYKELNVNIVTSQQITEKGIKFIFRLTDRNAIQQMTPPRTT